MSKQIKIDTTQIDGYKNIIKQICNKASELDRDIKRHAISKGYVTIRENLSGNSLSYYNSKLKDISDYLENTKRIFESLEDELSSIDFLNPKYTGFFTDKNVFGVVGSLGTVGKFSETFYELGKKNETIKDWLKDGKAILDIGDTIINDIIGRKGILDVDIISRLKDIKNITPSKIFETEFIEDLAGDFVTASKGSIGIAKWVKVLDGAVTVAENFEKNDNVVRAITESTVEIGVDAATDALLHAGMSTLGFAIMGPAGAAIGSVAADVTKIGIDWACEKMFGSDSTELISDFIIDTNIKKAKAIGDSFNAVGKWIKGLF